LHPPDRMRCSRSAMLALGHLLALLARLRKADGDCLLAALHRFAAAAAFERAALAPSHRAANVLGGATRISTGPVCYSLQLSQSETPPFARGSVCDASRCARRAVA